MQNHKLLLKNLSRLYYLLAELIVGQKDRSKQKKVV